VRRARTNEESLEQRYNERNFRFSEFLFRYSIRMTKTAPLSCQAVAFFFSFGTDSADANSNRFFRAYPFLFFVICSFILLYYFMAPCGRLSTLCKRIVAYRIERQSTLGSPYSITERRVPELIPVLGSQPACDVSHKPGGRLPLLSVRPAVTPATLNRAAATFAAW